ncbi:hypothetical protein TSOC_013967 [Tetrabaena socialis]|uniref:Uncharacterized protein n=1 Tax=Tetrabaena socialis TaxID=47790 RepID=A0A2J7ZJ04_9CHLO|nr:hypothetical protein TSOC_013967 [Tetrabaena socialis]|eukprot:PNH00230.1 hypothetical protein TSOC_013967 [Tetrabaena socialis]
MSLEELVEEGRCKDWAVQKVGLETKLARIRRVLGVANKHLNTLSAVVMEAALRIEEAADCLEDGDLEGAWAELHFVRDGPWELPLQHFKSVTELAKARATELDTRLGWMFDAHLRDTCSCQQSDAAAGAEKVADAQEPASPAADPEVEQVIRQSKPASYALILHEQGVDGEAQKWQRQRG